ncbi:unnamed protein product, partial [Strongylus vulgaris]
SVDLSTILSASTYTTDSVSTSVGPSTTSAAVTATSASISLTDETTPLANAVASEVEDVTSEEPTSRRTTEAFNEILETTTATEITAAKKSNTSAVAFSEVDFNKDEQTEGKHAITKKVDAAQSSSLAQNERQFAAKTQIPESNNKDIYGLKKIKILPKVSVTDSPTTPAAAVNPITSTAAPTTVNVVTSSNTATSAPTTTSASAEDDVNNLEDVSRAEIAASWESAEDVNAFTVGREPVPIVPTGIGRNMAKLDIDDLGKLLNVLSK